MSDGGNNKCAHGNLDECYGLGIDQSTSARSLHQAAEAGQSQGPENLTQLFRNDKLNNNK